MKKMHGQKIFPIKSRYLYDQKERQQLNVLEVTTPQYIPVN